MRRAALTLLVALTLTGTAMAIPIPIPGGEHGQLAIMLSTLYRIERVIGHMRAIATDIKTKLDDVYPDKVIRHIPIYFEPVKSLQAEIGELSTLWEFSPRVNRLKRALYDGEDFCRDDYRALYGLPPMTADADLEEFEDWQAVTDIKVLSDHVSSSQKRADTAHWLMNETLQGTPYGDPSLKYSPGYSNRLAALGAAQLGNLLAESGKLQQRELELAHTRFIRRKRRERYVTDFTLQGYALLAGMPLAGGEVAP